MIKFFLSVVVFGVIAFSGCSQTKAEVKAPAETNAIKTVDVNATKAAVVVEKAVAKVGGGATHVPFSEMAK